MNGKNSSHPTISMNEAIDLARAHIKGLDFVNPEAVISAELFTHADALAIGMPTTPQVKDQWLINFKRVAVGHPLDGLFHSLMVAVDAETGVADIQEDL